MLLLLAGCQQGCEQQGSWQQHLSSVGVDAVCCSQGNWRLYHLGGVGKDAVCHSCLLTASSGVHAAVSVHCKPVDWQIGLC